MIFSYLFHDLRANWTLHIRLLVNYPCLKAGASWVKRTRLVPLFSPSVDFLCSVGILFLLSNPIFFMLIEALMSLSWVVPHSLQVHSLSFSVSSWFIVPQLNFEMSRLLMYARVKRPNWFPLCYSTTSSLILACSFFRTMNRKHPKYNNSCRMLQE